jgi:hypothetical protein
MKKFIVVCFILINAAKLNAQCPSDSIKLVEYLENAVLKNIYSYRILLSPRVDSLYNGDLWLNDYSEFDSIIPNSEYKLNLDIEYYGQWADTRKYEYHLGEYIEVTTDYRAYLFHKSADYYINDLGEGYISTYYSRYFPKDDIFLAAINPESCDIKFLGGNFFISRPTQWWFKADTLSRSCIYCRTLIKARAIKYQLKNIKWDIEQSKNGICVYTAYSEYLKKHVVFSLTLKEPDKVYLEYPIQVDDPKGEEYALIDKTVRIPIFEIPKNYYETLRDTLDRAIWESPFPMPLGNN